MGDKKRAWKKCVLLISPYLWNYSSNYKILKSLTQLCKYQPKQHTAYMFLLRSPQKMPTFSEILFFGKIHAVLEVQHLQPSLNGKNLHHQVLQDIPSQKGPIVKAYFTAKS
jgi:hypothetical protein